LPRTREERGRPLHARRRYLRRCLDRRWIRRRQTGFFKDAFDGVADLRLLGGERDLMPGKREPVAHDNLALGSERRQHVFEDVRRGAAEDSLACLFTRETFGERLRLV